MCHAVAPSRTIARSRSCRPASGHPGAAWQHPPRAYPSRPPRRPHCQALQLVQAVRSSGAGRLHQQLCRQPGLSDSLQQACPPFWQQVPAGRRCNLHPKVNHQVQTPVQARQHTQVTAGPQNCWRPVHCLALQRLHSSKPSMAGRLVSGRRCVQHRPFWQLFNPGVWDRHAFVRPQSPLALQVELPSCVENERAMNVHNQHCLPRSAAPSAAPQCRRRLCRSLRPSRARCCARWATRLAACPDVGQRPEQAAAGAAAARTAGRQRLHRLGLVVMW